MKIGFWIGVAVLLVLHQDYWQWNDATLDFGFLPRSMTYHAAISLIAVAFWVTTTLVWWPQDLAESGNTGTDDRSEEQA